MSSVTMEVPSTNTQEPTSTHHQDSNQATSPAHLAIQEEKMESELVKQKPIKRIVPEKIAEVGQWKAEQEDKLVDEEDKAIHKDGKAVDEGHKAEMSTGDAKMD